MKVLNNFNKKASIIALAGLMAFTAACSNTKEEAVKEPVEATEAAENNEAVETTEAPEETEVTESTETNEEPKKAKDIREVGITDPYVNPDVTFSNLKSEEDQAALSKDLEAVGIDKAYIEDYMKYVNIYNETAPDSVLDGWNTLDKVNYSSYEIYDQWVEKYPDFMGICCRMAVFTLLRDDLVVNNEFEKIAEEALVFDLFAFENMPKKHLSDEDLQTFEKFFLPIPTTTSTDREEQKKILEKALVDRGIEFKNDKLKLIAMVAHDTVDETRPFLFIDHIGVIYEKDGNTYLLEKLAFQEPYQWIKFPSEDEIIKYFESKYNLDTTGQMAEPLYMINGEVR